MSPSGSGAVQLRRWPLWLGLVLAMALAGLAATPSGDALQSRLGPLYERLDGRSVSPHLWLAMAEDPFPEVRRLAVHVLASVADPAHLPLLERYQRDPSPAVRAEVMVAAGRLGAPGVGLAREGLRDATPVVRQAAAWALAHGGASGCDTLLARLPVERDPAVLETMLGNLYRCGEQDWAPAAARVAEAASPGLRRAAAAALARGAGHAALDRLARDPEPVIRTTALAGLIHGPFGTGRAALVAAALDDADWRVRAAACTVLVARGEAAITADIGRRLVALAQAPQLHLRIAAIRALGAHPEAGSTETLLSWTGSEAPWIAAEALDAAARREPAKVLPTLTTWLADPSTAHRRAAAAAVTRLPSAARGPLETLVMADRDAGVRLAWLERLEAVPDGRVEWLRDRLRTDPDPAVRSAILDLLAAAGQAGDRGQLLDRARSWRNDRMGDARTSALLAALAVSVDDRSRREVVALALADADDGVAARLVAAARELGLPAHLPAREPRHGAAWYRELADWASEPRWLDVATPAGTFRIRLDTAAAPITSREIFDLARSGFYDGLTLHRVVPNFVVQGGDPRGDGWGGPGFTLPDEPSMVPFDSWRVGIATSGPHTGGCQLFVTLLPADRLTGHYTNFGEVVEGRETLTRIGVGDHLLRVTPRTGEPGPLTPTVVSPPAAGEP